MESLLDYLIRNKEEREAKMVEYTEAVNEYHRAKQKVESYGDISLVQTEIEKLTAYVKQVAEQLGAVEYEGTNARAE